MPHRVCLGGGVNLKPKSLLGTEGNVQICTEKSCFPTPPHTWMGINLQFFLLEIERDIQICTENLFAHDHPHGEGMEGSMYKFFLLDIE